MATGKRSHVIGVFHDRGAADRAMTDLRTAGFRDDELGYAARHEGKLEGSHPGSGPEMDLGAETGDQSFKEFKGALAGTAVGGLLGAAAAALIPGVGPVLAGGFLASTLLGAGAGAAAGGLIGALSEMGYSEDEARFYDRELQAGRTLVTVRPGDRETAASEVFERHGGYDHTRR